MKITLKSPPIETKSSFLGPKKTNHSHSRPEDMEPSTPVPATPLALVPAEDEDPSPLRQGFAKPSPKVTKETTTGGWRTVARKMLEMQGIWWDCLVFLTINNLSFIWFWSTQLCFLANESYRCLLPKTRKHIECSNIACDFMVVFANQNWVFPCFPNLSRGRVLSNKYSDILYDNPTSLAGSSKNVFVNVIDDFLVAGKREQGGDRLKANYWTLTQLMVLRSQAWEERTHQGGKHQIWETRGYEKDMIVNHSQSWSTVLKDAGMDENLVIPQYECWGHSIYFRLVVADGYGLKKKISSTPGSDFCCAKWQRFIRNYSAA